METEEGNSFCRPSNSELSSTTVKLMPSHHPARKSKPNQK